jgi:tRNA G18 (ribose-2'-O)-methylase SpoU
VAARNCFLTPVFISTICLLDFVGLPSCRGRIKPLWAEFSRLLHFGFWLYFLQPKNQFYLCCKKLKYFTKNNSAVKMETLQESRLNCIKYNVHSCFQDKTPEETATIAKRLALPVHIMLFNLDGNMNIAMTIRTAAVLGCSDVYVVGRRKYDARPEVGSKNYIKVHKVETLEDPPAFFHERNLQPFLIEQGGSPLETFNFKPTIKSKKPVCFIMGSESHGLPPVFLAQMRDAPRISISQYGMVRSLNVSIAGSILMYEFLKQWRETNALTL